MADIFVLHGEAYRRTHRLSVDQRKAMRAIEACRTAQLGGHLYVCQQCDYQAPAYNSCRNRHCPKCQSLKQARWIEQRKQRVLNVKHFHVVMTLPQELRPLAWNNRKAIFNLLFASSAKTLLELGEDPDRLGVQLGITSVLHTWTRRLTFHPHIHSVVTAGGLATTGSDRFIHTQRDFLFPVAVIAKLFRGKVLDGLTKLYKAEQLQLVDSCAHLADPEAFRVLIDSLYRKSWVVYCKPPFRGAKGVFDYLGRYTHRTGISNHRLLDVTDAHITFLTKDGRTETIVPKEFIRRFLSHILPRRYVKIRHYGLLAAANVNTKLQRAHQLLGHQSAVESVKALDWIEHLRLITGIDLLQCPRCKKGRLSSYPLPKLDTS